MVHKETNMTCDYYAMSRQTAFSSDIRSSNNQIQIMAVIVRPVSLHQYGNENLNDIGRHTGINQMMV